MSLEINVEHLVAHIHTQNGLAESLIKCLRSITRPLLLRTKLQVFTWGHTVLHATALICIRSIRVTNSPHYNWFSVISHTFLI
jgi:hypothetical protein